MGGYIKVTASVISKDEGKSYEFNPRKTGNNASKYYFELTNVQGNHETFDALVEFNGEKVPDIKRRHLLIMKKEKTIIWHLTLLNWILKQMPF